MTTGAFPEIQPASRPRLVPVSNAIGKVLLRQTVHVHPALVYILSSR